MRNLTDDTLLLPGAVVLLGVPFDQNASFLRGAALAPARIREALLCGSSNLCNEAGLDLAEHPCFYDAGDLPLSSPE
ncbi:MAG: arginase family protein, partial [Chloroflexia bacterium]